MWGRAGGLASDILDAPARQLWSPPQRRTVVPGSAQVLRPVALCKQGIYVTWCVGGLPATRECLGPIPASSFLLRQPLRGSKE